MAVVRYIVDDVPSAVNFYQACLGFEPVEIYGDAMAIISRGDLQLWLAGPRSSARRSLSTGGLPSPGGWARIVVQVSDLDETARSLRGQGINIRGDIVSGPGGRHFVCDDPSGNAVEVFGE